NDDGSFRVAVDGAWTWFNDPRALFHNGALYVGFVRMADGASCVNAINTNTRTFATVLVSDRKQKDDHNNPALLPLEDGRLMTFYCRHSIDKYSQYCTSLTTTPATAVDWDSWKDSQVFTSSAVSYQNPYQLSVENGRIYNFFRDQGWDPCFITSDDLGQTWSTSNYLINAGNTNVRPYVKYASNYKDRIDVLYTDDHPKPTQNSLYHFYIKGGKIYKTDGTTLKTAANPAIERTLANLPILHDSGERGTVIYQYSDVTTTNYDNYIPGGRAWCSDIVYDKNGNPVCVFSVQLKKTSQSSNADWDQSREFYYYARFDSTTNQWKKRLIAYGGRPLYNDQQHYSGNIALDPENPDIVYISTNAALPFALTVDLAPTNFYQSIPLAENARYEIWRGALTDEADAAGDIAFDWTPMTQNSIKDNFRPYVPRNSPYAESLVYFYGTYTTYTNFSTEVRGIFKNKKQSFADWVTDQGLTGNDALPDADPGEIGITNLVAYAFGITPGESLSEIEQAKLPCMGKTADGEPAFRFEKNTALPDIDYVVQTSTDLKNWEDTASVVESTDVYIEKCIVAPVISGSEDRRFFRVKIIQK
ncbi:MAG: BNR repeat-containing protein, partial [Puniceicoccales bacterium]|nr:BNR repeat-containing protein [Puniceicoccales bacterium]